MSIPNKDLCGSPEKIAEALELQGKALERISCKRMDLGGEIIPTEEAVWAMSALADWRGAS